MTLLIMLAGWKRSTRFQKKMSRAGAQNVCGNCKVRR